MLDTQRSGRPEGELLVGYGYSFTDRVWSERPIMRCVFLITSLYVPSGLQTGTKTCGKSFLACCSVYFFSATHLDVSEENHKSPESANVTEEQGSGCSPSGFLWRADQQSYKKTTKKRNGEKKKEFLNDGESRRWVQDERRGAGGNNLRHLGRGKYLCGWERNQRPGLIREKSGESALRLLVKPLASRAARAPPGEHSRHP